MKGVVLAGGLGTRLRPLTLVTNKHLLPVYDQPMIHYPIRMLAEAGIDDVLVVTGGEHAGDFARLLRDGRHLGVRRLEYAYQEGQGGIADALMLAESFAEEGRVCVALGDNIIEGSLRGAASAFARQASGARLLLKETAEAHRFGVALLEGTAITGFIEKPPGANSGMAVVGIYFYDRDVFDICRGLAPSARGELEITDVNTAYLRRGDLEYEVLDGWWADAGTFDGLLGAANAVRVGRAKNQPLVRRSAGAR
jgi:glucose-1-phosphate thymidylyltransferase